MQRFRTAITIVSAVVAFVGAAANSSATQQTTEEHPYICDPGTLVSAVCLDPYQCEGEGTADCEAAAELFNCGWMQFAQEQCTGEVSNCDSGVICYKQN
jgi:dihydroorotase-like cyclic amidohydrolase